MVKHEVSNKRLFCIFKIYYLIQLPRCINMLGLYKHHTKQSLCDVLKMDLLLVLEFSIPASRVARAGFH
jgi:hypothetical protein